MPPVVNVANHKYPGRGVTGVILALTESKRILHSIYGGNSAAEEKWSPKSARENAGRSGGGVITTVIVSLIIGPLLTPLNTLQALLAGLLHWY